jgi:fluoride exporter
MSAVLWVALGGAIGSAGRYLLGSWIGSHTSGRFPWHTLTVNVLGCLAIGMLWAYMNRNLPDPAMRLFLVTGILGGFTTFSSFGLETFQLIQAREYVQAFSYVALSNLAGIGVLMAAYKLFAS